MRAGSSWPGLISATGCIASSSSNSVTSSADRDHWKTTSGPRSPAWTRVGQRLACQSSCRDADSPGVGVWLGMTSDKGSSRWVRTVVGVLSSCSGGRAGCDGESDQKFPRGQIDGDETVDVHSVGTAVRYHEEKPE